MTIKLKHILSASKLKVHCDVRQERKPTPVQRVLLYYKVNQLLLVDLFYIGFNISVARVGRTGAWDSDPVN